MEPNTLLSALLPTDLLPTENKRPKVLLSTSGKFHTFDLARQLHQWGMLEAIYTGYPRYKLKQENLPPALIRTFPWVALGSRAFGRLTKNHAWQRAVHYFLVLCQDAYVQAVMPPSDVFIGLSGVGLLTGRKVQRKGGLFICDRGSAHIRFQDEILAEEFARHGQPYVPVSPRMVKKEEQEYAAADYITVPSTFALRSFIQMGIAKEKLRLVPYGVDLSRFSKVADPDPEHFDVLFVGAASLQKGIPYLLESFEKLRHPGKRLTLAGQILPEVHDLIQQYAQRLPITCLGHVPQPELKELMSRSHAFVLPSIQDGFGMVMAQAMACGCPVVASEHTGAFDLYDDGAEGFIVPIRDSHALAERLQRLADDPALQQEMAAGSLARVRSLGGWSHYGDTMMAVFQNAARGNVAEKQRPEEAVSHR